MNTDQHGLKLKFCVCLYPLMQFANSSRLFVDPSTILFWQRAPFCCTIYALTSHTVHHNSQETVRRQHNGNLAQLRGVLSRR